MNGVLTSVTGACRLSATEATQKPSTESPTGQHEKPQSFSARSTVFLLRPSCEIQRDGKRDAESIAASERDTPKRGPLMYGKGGSGSMCPASTASR